MSTRQQRRYEQRMGAGMRSAIEAEQTRIARAWSEVNAEKVERKPNRFERRQQGSNKFRRATGQPLLDKKGNELPDTTSAVKYDEQLDRLYFLHPTKGTRGVSRKRMEYQRKTELLRQGINPATTAV